MSRKRRSPSRQRLSETAKCKCFSPNFEALWAYGFEGDTNVDVGGNRPFSAVSLGDTGSFTVTVNGVAKTVAAVGFSNGRMSLDIGPYVFATGDVIRVVSPSPPDATITPAGDASVRMGGFDVQGVAE